MRKKICLVILLITLLWTACSPSIQLNETKVDYPVAVASLEQNAIEFHCLNSADCFSAIELRDIGLENQEEAILGSVFYLNPGYIGLFIRSGLSQYLISIDRATEEINVLPLPENLEMVFLWEVLNEHVIITNKTYRPGENLWIINQDFSIQSIPFKMDGKLPAISNLVVSSDNHLIAINGSPVEENGKIYSEVIIIDVEQLITQNQRFELSGVEISHGADEVYKPDSNYLFRITNISPDLESIYYFYHHYIDDTEADLTFGKFISPDFQLEKSTNDLGCDGLMLVDNTQYRDIFYSNLIDIDGNVKAKLFDLNKMDFVIDGDEISKAGGEMIAPYGDRYLVGNAEVIKLITENNEVMAEFSLPIGFQPLSYQLVQYRNSDANYTAKEY